MNLNQELRQILYTLWKNSERNNGVSLNNKKYNVGKMSYDEYFIEPYRRNRTERDEFHKDTLWEKSDGIEIMQLFLDDNFIKITIN